MELLDATGKAIRADLRVKKFQDVKKFQEKRELPETVFC
jgi:hypothetical protein